MKIREKEKKEMERERELEKYILLLVSVLIYVLLYGQKVDIYIDPYTKYSSLNIYFFLSKQHIASIQYFPLICLSAFYSFNPFISFPYSLSFSPYVLDAPVLYITYITNTYNNTLLHIHDVYIVCFVVVFCIGLAK